MTKQTSLEWYKIEQQKSSQLSDLQPLPDVQYTRGGNFLLINTEMSGFSDTGFQATLSGVDNLVQRVRKQWWARNTQQNGRGAPDKSQKTKPHKAPFSFSRTSKTTILSKGRGNFY